MYTFIPYTNCPAFSQWLPCNAVSHSGPEVWCKRLCSGPVDAQRLPRLRRLLRKLSAIGCRVLDRICTRLYLTQITRRSDNGYRAMQFRILARQGGVNACALARWTHSAFRPAIFCFLLEIPIHFIFRLHPKYTKSQSRKTPAPVSRSGDSAFCERGSLRSIY